MSVEFTPPMVWRIKVNYRVKNRQLSLVSTPFIREDSEIM